MEENIPNAARAILLQRGCSCVVLRGDKVLTAQGIGVKPLMEFLRQDSAVFQQAVVADKVIGKAAAMLLAAGGAASVFGHIMSESALVVLQANGVSSSWDELVPYIKNRANTGMCPLEESVAGLAEPAQAFPILEKRIAELMSQKNS